MKISYKINGAFKDVKGDDLISCTKHFSLEIQQYGLSYTDELSNKYATCLLAFCKGVERKSYMVSVLQGNHTVFKEHNRAYATRCVYEVPLDEIKKLHFKLGSMVASVPEMPLEGYTKDYPFNDGHVDVKLIKACTESNVKVLSETLETAIYTCRKVFVKIRKCDLRQYYAGNLQKSELFNTLLAAIDNTNDKIRPYMSFAFGITQKLMDVADRYLIFFYHEGESIEIPTNAIIGEWDGSTILIDKFSDSAKFKMPDTNEDYSLANLFVKIQKDIENRNRVLSSNYKIKEDDLAYLLAIYNGSNVDYKEKAQNKLAGFLSDHNNFKYLRGYINESKLDEPLIVKIAKIIKDGTFKTFIKTDKMSEMKEVFEVFEKIGIKDEAKIKRCLVEAYKPTSCQSLEELYGKWDAVKDLYGFVVWNWEKTDLSEIQRVYDDNKTKDFVLPNDNNEFNNFIKKYIDEKMKPRTIASLTEILKKKTGFEIYLNDEDIVSLVDEVCDSPKKEFIKRNKESIIWLLHKVVDDRDKERLKVILDRIKVSKKIIQAVSKNKRTIIDVVVLIIFVVCSYIAGYNHFGLCFDSDSNIAVVDSDSVSVTYVDSLFITQTVNKECKYDTICYSIDNNLCLSTDSAKVSANFDSISIDIKHYMLPKDSCLRNVKRNYKFRLLLFK